MRAQIPPLEHMILDRPPQRDVRRSLSTGFLLLFASLALLVAGCARDPVYVSYSPHETVLSVAAEFELIASLDPYGDRMGRDLSGQSIARSTLVRLANYESVHPGRFRPEILLYKGRALELLGDYESAARNFREAADFDTQLSDEALRRAEILDAFRIMLTEPTRGSLDEILEDLGAQAAELREFAGALDDPWYRAIALREWEATDVRRAELIAANRFLVANGDAQAIDAFQALLSDHRESARALEHALRLARFHRSLAEEEARLNPPETAWFSQERFKDHYDQATDLFYRISQADGEPERLIARHELDALLRFGETVGERMR